jgi:hypothetical protein
LIRSGLIFGLETLHIGTLRARYRAEHRNDANATVSTHDNDGEAHVAYEDGDEEDHTKEGLKNLLEAYGKGLFKEIVNGILPALDYLENRQTGIRSSMLKSEHAYLICKLVQLFDQSYVSERSVTIDLVRGLSKSSR